MYLMEKITVDKKDYWYLQQRNSAWDISYLTSYRGWKGTLTGSCLFDSIEALQALAFQTNVAVITVINATLFDGVVNYYCERHLEGDKLWLRTFQGCYDWTHHPAEWAFFASKEDLLKTLSNIMCLEQH